jgi:hypothetical protein
VFIQDYMDVWSPLHGTGMELGEINLWEYGAEPSQAKIFIASAETLPTNSKAGTSLAAQGAIYTFRTVGYRYPMRMYIMEGNQAGETRNVYGTLTGVAKAYADYVKSTASPIVGRNDDYPVSAIALNLGQNEKLRRIRFRSE